MIDSVIKKQSRVVSRLDTEGGNNVKGHDFH